LPTNLPNPLAIAAMAMKFVGRDTSVALVSEGLGPKKWHGRAAILVNEHSISAVEMIAAFASENRLATLVGAETAGRLIPGPGVRVGGASRIFRVPWSADQELGGSSDQLSGPEGQSCQRISTSIFSSE
jgi:hypothetical protein